MNPAETYDLCCKYHGKRVRISDSNGRVHVGEITRVDRRQVWILPDRRYSGYGLGFWGFGGGGFGGGGFGYGIALGTILGIALAPIIFF
ncbi:hypothetical protein [Lysinibacillus cavernae]|uniref:hypothetical protein n=1 Tax=Lysinibacillus cavernae TaxID=2666135 RepID=UPI0012D9EEC6|nr:hypothetical protein [Lysinibacillus cavernae]